MQFPSNLKQYPKLFASLEPIPQTAVSGLFHAEFVGPNWLRKIAPPGLKFLGLGNWWGKWFYDDGEGTNLVLHDGQLKPQMPITVKEQPSVLDGKPCLAVLYPSTSPFPWRHVIDELRIYDDGRYLGMTITNLPLIKRLPLPFVLHTNPKGPEVTLFLERYGRINPTHSSVK